MKIRPLHIVSNGSYISDDNNWCFKEIRNNPRKRNNPKNREWQAYQRMLDGEFYIDTPYFYRSYPTLKSLVKALDKAKPNVYKN